MYKIERLSLYGKKGYCFLDEKHGIFVYPLAGRDSIMMEAIRYAKYKEREGLYSKPSRRKFEQVEIPIKWLPTVTRMIEMLTGDQGIAEQVEDKYDMQKDFKDIGV